MRKIFLLLVGLVIVAGVINNILKDGMEWKWIAVLLITVISIVLLWIRPLRDNR